MYVGFFLRRLLKDSSHRIVMLIYASMVWVVLSFLGTLFSGVELREIVGDALSLLLGFYLLKNVRRLASEEQDPTLGALPGN